MPQDSASHHDRLQLLRRAMHRSFRSRYLLGFRRERTAIESVGVPQDSVLRHNRLQLLRRAMHRSFRSRCLLRFQWEQTAIVSVGVRGG